MNQDFLTHRGAILSVLTLDLWRDNQVFEKTPFIKDFSSFSGIWLTASATLTYKFWPILRGAIRQFLECFHLDQPKRSPMRSVSHVAHKLFLDSFVDKRTASTHSNKLESK